VGGDKLDQNSSTTAVKTIHTNTCYQDPQYEKEREALTTVKSPYVVSLVCEDKLFWVGNNTRLVYYFVMEAFNNGELSEWLGAEFKLRAVFYWQIAKGLLDMHNQGWMHLDIKLENVLVNCEHKICYAALIDLGLSEKHNVGPNNKKQKKCNRGTEGYMAPEMTSKPCDKKADIWSMGVVAERLFAIEKEHPKVKRILHGTKQRVPTRRNDSEVLLTLARELVKDINDSLALNLEIKPIESGARKPMPKCPV